MSEERDIIERRPARLGGFAPGGYFCKCVHCDEQFTGDKRAISCLPCAISFSEAEIQRLRGEVERLREALDELLFENSNKTEVERLVTRLKARDALSSAPKPEEG